MKLYLMIVLILAPLTAKAAAPDDINSNQRAWFDAVDIDGNSDYTDNPANNTAIAQWIDKSGSGNHLSQTAATLRPLYRQNTLSTQRHSVDFDGVNDVLTDANDIWTGSVSSTESFVVVSTDTLQKSFVFGSASTNSNRLSAHIPWNDGNTYFDQGACCVDPSRLYGAVPITLAQHYLWHFIGLPSMQQILQDSTLQLSDSGAGTYTVTSSSSFTLATFPPNSSVFLHHGSYFEAIFYQTGLNNAQRRILSGYLSAKWNKAFGTSPSYADPYDGDDPGNGDYDFFVGGIGQDNGTQTTGTSQGLTITDDSFLANGNFILAGVNYLVTSPLTGTVTTDLPSGYSERSERSWYIDRTGDGGLVNLSFDAASIGIPVINGTSYGLLHRTGTSGAFAEVDKAVMVDGVLDFSHLPADGVYTIGKPGEVILSLEKTNITVNDPINNLINPKAIPGSNTDYTLTVRNTGNGIPDAETPVIKDVIPSLLTLFTGDLNGSGSPFVFTDNNCPPTTNSMTSNLSLDYPDDVVFKDAAGTAITPSSDYDSSVRSFEITMSGVMNAISDTEIPCFTIRYRTQLD